MFQGRRQVELLVGGEEPDVDVPDVVDSREEDARQTLRDAGFRVEVVRDGDGDVVVDQQPAGGGTAPDGAVVTIVVR